MNKSKSKMKTSPKKCAILSCKSHLSRQEYTYYKIPGHKQAEKRKLWMKALDILDEDLHKTKKKHHFVCGFHFKPTVLGSQKFLKLSTILSHLSPNVQPSDSNVTDFVEEYETESTQHPQPIKDMTDLCRICLGTSDNFVSFNAELDFTCQTVCELVNYVTNVDIYEEEDQFDILPQHVCHKCIENLRIAFKLKNLAHESNNSLKEYLKTTLSNTDLVLNQEMIEEMETTSEPPSEEYSTSESNSSDNEENENRNIEGPLIVKQEMVADMETTSDPLAEEYSISHSEHHSSDKVMNDENERIFEESLTPRLGTYIKKLILESENRSMAVINRQASIIADIRASLLNMPSTSSTHLSISSTLNLNFTTHEELEEFEGKLSDKVYHDEVMNHLAKFANHIGYRSKKVGRVSSMLNLIIHPALREKYNWSGALREKDGTRTKNGKKAFKKFLKIVTVLFESMDKLDMEEKMDITQIKIIVTEYFKRQSIPNPPVSVVVGAEPTL